MSAPTIVSIEETVTGTPVYQLMPNPGWDHMKQIGHSPSGFAYLAGPYNALPDLQLHDGDRYCKVDANINEARRWAVRLALDGIPFFSPALNSAHFDTIVPAVAQGFWYEAGLEILKHARALFLLPDWRSSKGARAEMTFAQTNDISIFTHNMYEEFLRFWRTPEGTITEGTISGADLEQIRANNAKFFQRFDKDTTVS